MNRTVRTLCVVSFLTVMVTASTASRALSGPWVGAKVPPVICLVGTSSGEPDRATGQFTLSLYDVAQNPRAGASVIFDASQCPDLFICADQKDAGTFVNCSAKYVRKFADAQGRVTFTILGGSKGPGAAQIVGSYGRLFANGILLGHPVFAAYDLDGVRGVGPNDLSAWLSDWASGFSWARSDPESPGPFPAPGYLRQGRFDPVLCAAVSVAMRGAVHCFRPDTGGPTP